MPPVFSIKTPFMVFGIELEVAIVLDRVGIWSWDWIEQSRAVAARMRGDFVENRLMIDMHGRFRQENRIKPSNNRSASQFAKDIYHEESFGLFLGTERKRVTGSQRRTTKNGRGLL